MARFFPTGAALSTEDINAATRAYQWGAVLPTTTAVPDLIGTGIHEGMQMFRTSTVGGLATTGMFVQWTFTTVAQHGIRETAVNARFGARFSHRWRWQHANNDNQRVVVGYSSSVLASVNATADDPATNYIFLQQLDGAGSWRATWKDTGGSQETASFAFPSDTDIKDLEIIYESASEVAIIGRDAAGDVLDRVDLDGGDNIPSSSRACAPTWAIDNLSGTAICNFFHAPTGHIRGALP